MDKPIEVTVAAIETPAKKQRDDACFYPASVVDALLQCQAALIGCTGMTMRTFGTTIAMPAKPKEERPGGQPPPVNPTGKETWERPEVP